MAIPSLIIRLKRIQAVPENGMNREREKSESKLSWIGPLHRNGRDDDDDDETRSYRRKNRADADQSSSVRIKNVSLFSLSVCVHFYCQRVLYLRRCDVVFLRFGKIYSSGYCGLIDCLAHF